MAKRLFLVAILTLVAFVFVLPPGVASADPICEGEVGPVGYEVPGCASLVGTVNDLVDDIPGFVEEVAGDATTFATETVQAVCDLAFRLCST